MPNVISETDVPTLDIDDPDDTPLWANAYHEAGHAVLSIELRIGIGRQGVTIVPNEREGYEGIAHSLKGFRGKLDCETTGYMRSGIEKRVMVMLAGVAAQRAYSNHSVRKYHGSSDRDQAQELLERIMVSDRELKPWIEVLEVRAETMVGAPVTWAKIKAVAEALMKRKTLKSIDVKAICEATFQRLEAASHARPDGE